MADPTREFQSTDAPQLAESDLDAASPAEQGMDDVDARVSRIKHGMQERIDKLTAERAYLREANDEMVARMQNLERGQASLANHLLPKKEPGLSELNRDDKLAIIRDALDSPDENKRRSAQANLVDLIETIAEQKAAKRQDEFEGKQKREAKIYTLRDRVTREIGTEFGPDLSSKESRLRAEANLEFQKLQEAYGDDIGDRVPDLHTLAYVRAKMRLESGDKPFWSHYDNMRRSTSRGAAPGIEGRGSGGPTEPSAKQRALRKGDLDGALSEVAKALVKGLSGT